MNKRTKKTSGSALNANLQLLNDNQNTLAAEQVELLSSIEACGSISAAAKQVGISYKTAWDRVEALNNLSDKPLVLRSAGGAKGGGTSLTPYGQQIVAGFHALQDEHHAFLDRLNQKIHSFKDVANFMKIGSLTTSARNQYRGTVTAIKPGAVNCEVTIALSQSQQLIATITEESREQMKLKTGSVVIALVKASWILVSKDIDIVTSARNKLVGKLLRIQSGAVNSDVIIDLGEGKSISAVITNDSVEALSLSVSDPVCALFKASSIILMADQ